MYGCVHKFSFLCRVNANISHLLQPLEDTIRSQFIPTLTGHAPPSDSVRLLLALPPRLGGLGIVNPTKMSEFEHSASIKQSSPLRDLILEQDPLYSYEVLEAQTKAKSAVRRQRKEMLESAAGDLRPELPTSLRRAMDLAQEKGASSWLTALPIDEFGFTLHKSAFRDALALRYGWPPSRTPTTCACGSNFSVEHTLSCPKGGFPIIRHNEVRDLTANLLSEVCHNVAIEPALQPLSGEVLSGASAIVDDGARLDWRFERAFFDVRVFNPHARSNRQHNLAATYRKHECLKQHAYKQRVREVEHGTFTPLVMALTGGLGKAASICYKRLASLLASKRDQPYSSTIAWLRCRLCFCLLHSSIQCIRGARSACGRASNMSVPQLDLVVSEASISS